ncbi:MAG: hypothetical protein LUB63_01835, partial [Oscillospiraceae bacterium]|nr:hypothetical protein [Oscillospiraceae bacterium]
MREKDVRSDALREESARLESAAGECETALSVLQNNIENNLKNVQRIQGELEAQEGRAGGLAGQMDQRQARLVRRGGATP